MATKDLSFTEAEWARDQTCRPLGCNADVRVAEHFLKTDELPLHHDKWKNWDNYLAIHHAARLCIVHEPVLDAGACRDKGSPSAFLPGLHKLGFTDLRGCNLDEPKTDIEDGIMYQHQDITGTTYPGNYFRFVACLSVIEHGVNVNKYLAEMARIIAPGGYLFTSFDYWPNPVDTHGQTAFGVPIKIFTAQDVMSMANYAHNCGLRLMKRPILDAKERPVEWLGMRYTFMNLLMQKERVS
jgi:SAM-dependent methyltransferase